MLIGEFICVNADDWIPPTMNGANTWMNDQGPRLKKTYD